MPIHFPIGCDRRARGAPSRRGRFASGISEGPDVSDVLRVRKISARARARACGACVRRVRRVRVACVVRGCGAPFCYDTGKRRRVKLDYDTVVGRQIAEGKILIDKVINVAPKCRYRNVQ